MVPLRTNRQINHTFQPADFAWSTAVARSLSDASTTLSWSSSSYYRIWLTISIKLGVETIKNPTKWKWNMMILKYTRIWGSLWGSMSSPILWMIAAIRSAKLCVSEVKQQDKTQSTTKYKCIAIFRCWEWTQGQIIS